VENDPAQVCTCDGELISMFKDWLGEREGEARVRIKFECCKCGRIAVVRIMNNKEDQ
jgi:hypothetical protein